MRRIWCRKRRIVDRFAAPVCERSQKQARRQRTEPGEGYVSTGTEASAYALLTDGTTIEIRPARPEDFEAVRDMHTKMSPDNLYLRFFGVSALAAEREARRICREPAPDHAALLAVLEGEVVGCGSYECADDGSRSAEAAMAVAD